METELKRRRADFDPERFLAEYPFYTDTERLFRFTRDRVLGPEKTYAVVDAMMRSDRGLTLKPPVARSQ